MKKTAWILAVMGMMFIPRAHGQVPFTVPNVVAAAAEATQTDPLPAWGVPGAGMFYSAQNLNAPPAPGNFANLPSWPLGNGCYLLDDLEGDIQPGDRTKDDGGGPPGPGDGGTNYSGGGSTNSPFYGFDTNALWLEIDGVTNGEELLALHNATNQVYAILASPILSNPLTNWQVVSELWPTNTNSMPFTAPISGSTNALFFMAEDWTGVTEGTNTVPNWWLWQFFGSDYSTLSDSTLDSQGNTLLFDYQNGDDPNVISFGLEMSNNYVNVSVPPMGLNVLAGWPYYIAISVDDTNYLADADWQPYTGSNITVNLGSVQGWHDVWVGLRGFPANETQTWHYERLNLELSPPPLFITNPTSSVTSQPTLELQGYSPRQLTAISYTLQNGAGTVSNMPGLVINQTFDTNLAAFTTNTFQCFDIPLTTGLNTISLFITDRAGSTAATNISMTLDFSGDTNPPVIGIYWPQDGELVSGTNCTLRGTVDDFTANVSAQILDSSGNTNVYQALVERNGLFWVEGIGFSPGTNYVTITAMDAAGNSSTTNLKVIDVDASAANPALTIADFSSELGGNPRDIIPAVNGTISLTNCILWVNGVEATQDGAGNWQAVSVPVGAGGTAVVEARAIPNTPADNYGNGAGTAPSTDGTPSNPTSADSVADQLQIDQPVVVYMQEYHYALNNSIILTSSNCPSWDYADILNGTLDESGAPGVPASMGSGIATADDLEAGTWDHQKFNWDCGQCAITNQSIDSLGDTNTSDVDLYYVLYWVQEHGSFKTTTPTAQWDLKANFNSTETDGCPETTVGHYTESLKTKMTLQTGGKATANSQNVFGISVAATSYIPTGTWVDSFSSASVSPNTMTVLGKAPGSDGMLWTLLPANATMDITPQAPLLCYTYAVGASSYPIDVMATDGVNTYDLTTNNPPPTFCVGEQLSFSLSSSPPYSLAMVHWNLPAKYVNATQQTNSSGSINYYINDSLLYNTAPPDSIGTQCWYINGTGGAVSAATTYTFANGQTVSIAPQGTFSIFRPGVTLPSTEIGHPRFFSVTPGSFGGATVKLGTPGAQADGEMYFTPLCQTEFSGTGMLTQTCQLGYNPDPGGFNFSDWRLDGSINYAGPAAITAEPVPVHFPTLDDGPQNGTIFSTSSIEVKGNFMDYVRFNPNTPGSTYATLGIVSWNIDGVITNGPSGWTLVTSNTPDPVLNTSDQFPFYTQPR